MISQKQKNYDTVQMTYSNEYTAGYHIEGNSKSILLFIHGMNAHSGTWRKNIPYFSRQWTAIAPSLPPIDRLSEHTITQHIRIILKIIRTLAMERLSLVGNSLGGLLSSSLLAYNELPVCSLILEDTMDLCNTKFMSEKVVDIVNRQEIPTLLIWGEKDSIIPMSVGEKLNKLITNSRLIIIKDAGHTPHWERPDEFNKVVFEFLENNAC